MKKKMFVWGLCSKKQLMEPALVSVPANANVKCLHVKTEDETQAQTQTFCCCVCTKTTLTRRKLSLKLLQLLWSWLEVLTLYPRSTNYLSPCEYKYSTAVQTTTDKVCVCVCVMSCKVPRRTLMNSSWCVTSAPTAGGVNTTLSTITK